MAARWQDHARLAMPALEEDSKDQLWTMKLTIPTTGHTNNEIGDSVWRLPFAVFQDNRHRSSLRPFSRIHILSACLHLSFTYSLLSDPCQLLLGDYDFDTLESQLVWGHIVKIVTEPRAKRTNKDAPGMRQSQLLLGTSETDK